MALLALLILAGLVGLVLVTTVVGSAPDDANATARLSWRSARAKESLIAYAVTYMDDASERCPRLPALPRPGIATSLREGAASGTCGTGIYRRHHRRSNEIGRLPWYTLGIEPLRDGYGECLWYAVSATFKNNPEPALLNWDSQGRFQIVGPDGTTLLAGATDPDLVVAVIMAPGATFGSQTRRGEGHRDADLRRELRRPTTWTALVAGGTAVDNADSDHQRRPHREWRFIQGARRSTFNDRLVYITVRDIWDAIARRTDLQTRFNDLTRQVAVCIASYPPSASSTDRRLPWAVAFAAIGLCRATRLP